jgi:hypothetical protein
MCECSRTRYHRLVGTMKIREHAQPLPAERSCRGAAELSVYGYLGTVCDKVDRVRVRERGVRVRDGPWHLVCKRGWTRYNRLVGKAESARSTAVRRLTRTWPECRGGFPPAVVHRWARSLKMPGRYDVKLTISIC